MPGCGASLRVGFRLHSVTKVSRKITYVAGVANVYRYRFLVRAIRRFTVRPVLPDSLRPLEDLVTNLRWSWHPETQDLFQLVSPEAWTASHHDPVRFLGLIP